MGGSGYSRRFLFFEKDLLKEPVTKLPFSELKDVDITCTATGRGFLWLGDSLGVMRRVDGSLKVCLFKSHERKLSHCYQMKQNDVLLTIGHDDMPTDSIKVWNMGKWDGEGMPFCSRIIQACHGDVPQSPVTCIEVLENMTCMVLGHESGVIQIFKGDVTRERHSKRRILHRMPRAITGLGFQAVQSNSTVIYVTTESSITSITIDSKDNDQKIVLDQFGCPSRCTTMTDAGKSSNFVVAVKDAIYFYEPDSRGPCIAIDGEKSLICFYKNYLVIVKQATQLASSGLSMQQLTIFDYTNKFIAGDFPLTDVRAILCEWGSLFILCGAPNNQIFKLIEKDTQSKLELLFSKNNYNLAIDIAKSQHYDEDGLADIFRRYADHLYNKKEYDKAIEEYIKTIGKLEASYVIQRFLDTSRIHNLTAYLQKLHRAKLATEDHTTLLLNCYTKLKDEENLNNFINSDQEVYYDVETAIRVLRQSNYYKQALGLAERFNRHVLYLRILVEDLKQADQAIQYINQLPFDDALMGVSTHGKFLMSENHQESAKILEKLCSSPEATKMNVNDFLKIFVNNRAGLIEFLDRYISRTDSSDIVTGVVDTLLELCLYEMCRPESEKTKKIYYEKKVMDLLEKEGLPYDRLKALILCHQRGFQAGFLYLCEVAQDYDQMIRYHMQNNDYKKVLDTCKQYGHHTPDLWTEALAYFAHKADCDDMIRDIIIHIDKENLISPLLVVQRLAEGGKNACQLGVVKDYLLRRLQTGQEQLETDQETIRKYRQETEQNRETIRKLTSKVKIFQMQKCTLCHQSLDPPSVHFLCDHSYHMHCFQSYTENESECPSCLIKNRQFLAEVSQWESERHSDGGLDIPSLVQASIKGYSNQKTNLAAEGDYSPESSTTANTNDGIRTNQNASFQLLSNSVEQGVMWEAQADTPHKEERGFKPATYFEDKLKEVSASTANITSGIINQVKHFAQSKNSSYSDLNENNKNATSQPSSSRAHHQQQPDRKEIRQHANSNPFGSDNSTSHPVSSNKAQVQTDRGRAGAVRQSGSGNPFSQESSSNPFEEADSETTSRKNYPDHLNPF